MVYALGDKHDGCLLYAGRYLAEAQPSSLLRMYAGGEYLAMVFTSKTAKIEYTTFCSHNCWKLEIIPALTEFSFEIL